MGRGRQLSDLPSASRADSSSGSADGFVVQPGRHSGELLPTTGELDLQGRAPGFASVLRNRYFLRLWLAQLISQTIMNAANYGLIVLASTEGGSLTATAIAIVAFNLPALILGAPAGVVVDRFDRRTVLWVSNALRALASLFFVVSLLIDRTALLPVYLLTFFVASVGQFFAPAEGAAIPSLVKPKELMSALALFNITFTAAQALGLMLLGPLVLLLPTIRLGTTGRGVDIVPVETLFLLVALLYVVCSVIILSIPVRLLRVHGEGHRRVGRRRPEESRLRAMWAGIFEAVRHIRRDQVLEASLWQLSLGGVFTAVIAMIAPTFVAEFLFLPKSLAALVFLPAGVGLVIGSALTPRIAPRLRAFRTVALGVAMAGASTALLTLARVVAPLIQPDGWSRAWPYIGLILLLTFFIGVALDFINIPAQTLMQERSPDWIKGRVLAVQMMVLNALTIPLVLGVGYVADALGLIPTMPLLAAVILLAGLGGVYYGVQGQRKLAARTAKVGKP